MRCSRKGAMHKYFLIFLLFLPTFTHSKTEKLSQKILKYLEKNTTHTKAIIQDTDAGLKQKLDYEIMGLHKKKCQVALSRLSQYERYSEFLDVIKKSTYNDKSKYIYLHLSHSLMPFDMSLHFKLDRVETPGIYQFSFGTGFLRGLKGTIDISEYKNRCLFHTKAKWSGPHTKINSTIFSFFTKAVGIIAMKRLLKISEIY